MKVMVYPHSSLLAVVQSSISNPSFYLEKTLHVIGYVAHDQNASINHANESYPWTWRILAYTFTTGSCAEFYFKPLKRLLSMYIKETTGKNVKLCGS
jgi:hypothetical protein